MEWLSYILGFILSVTFETNGFALVHIDLVNKTLFGVAQQIPSMLFGLLFSFGKSVKLMSCN